MDRFKTLADSNVVRYSLFAGMVALLIALVVLATTSQPQEEPEPEPTSTSVPNVMRPIEPTDPSDDEADEEGDATEPVEPVAQPTTDLSIEEQDQALTTAIDGFLAWYDYDPTMSVEERTARIQPFFVTGSPLVSLGPDGLDPEAGVFTRATLNWTEAVSADSEEVKVLIGARVSAQVGAEFFGDTDAGEAILSSDDAYLVTMNREEGRWLIASIEEDR